MSNLPQHLLEDPTGSAGLIKPKRGAEIFEGTDYPTEWADFIGQVEAIEQLQVGIASALARHTRMEHTLFDSSIAGVGKSTLATMTAYCLGVGIQRTAGPLTLESFRRLTVTMKDGDVLFSDEIHRLVEGNRNRADWLLPWMTEGVLYTERGIQTTPDITLIGATTDAGKLPVTIKTRFMVTPHIVEYTPAEATLIALNLSDRMQIPIDEDEADVIGTAADRNPRKMRKILITLRDHRAAEMFGGDWGKIFRRSGVTEDGLSLTALDILYVLRGATKQTMGIDNIKMTLGESGPIGDHEQMLVRRGYIERAGQGRVLTDRGRLRLQLGVRA